MADAGTGSSIVFATSSWTAQVVSINSTDISRPSLDTSHLATDKYRTKIPGDLLDPGGIDVEILLDPAGYTGTATGTAMVQYVSPITSTPETVTIYFPGTNTTASNNAGVFGTGFITTYSWGVPLEELMTGALHLEFSGLLSWKVGT